MAKTKTSTVETPSKTLEETVAKIIKEGGDPEPLMEDRTFGLDSKK